MNMGMIYLIFILFGLLFIQNLLNIFHYKRLMKQYKEICGHSHYQSVGNRKKWGRKRMAVLGFDKDGIVEECWILNGITVFAKFKRIKDFDGYTCERLLEILNPKKKDHTAIIEAATYMKQRLDDKNKDDKEYFEKPQDLSVKEETNIENLEV